MPRQYKMFYRRGLAGNYAQLEAGVHATLYGKPQVQAAIEHVRLNPEVEGIALRLDDEAFNVMAFNQDAVAPKAFVFKGEPGGPTLHDRLSVPTPLEGETVDKTNA